MTVCNRPCPFNRGGICEKTVVILNNGACSEWWDRNGGQYNPQFVENNYKELKDLLRKLRSNAAQNQQPPHVEPSKEEKDIVNTENKNAEDNNDSTRNGEFSEN